MWDDGKGFGDGTLDTMRVEKLPLLDVVGRFFDVELALLDLFGDLEFILFVLFYLCG